MTIQTPNPPSATLLIEDVTQLLTCNPQGSDLLGRIEGGAVAIAGERILAAGPASQVAAQVDLSRAHRIDASGKIVAPGFVDSHTHLVFGGSRAMEYAAGMTHTPDEVRAMGIPTGILASMTMTRAATLEELTVLARERVQAMLRHGSTTVESKSGYGLRLDQELKMLEVNQRIGNQVAVDVVSTFLGAHATPPDVSHGWYVNAVIDEMIPAIAEKGLARFCDVYCDQGYFTVDDARRILVAARQAGLQLKIHTDQYSALGGSELAAELEVTSADHLNFTERPAMRRLAQAGVVGVLMPAIDFAVQHPRPFDARAMLGEGMTLALASDFCPGGWTQSMQLVLQFACRLNRFSPQEALYAATVGGARALGLSDRGSLQPGQLADLQIWDLPSFEDLIYRLGHNAVETVVKRGQVVFSRTDPETR